MGKKPKPSAPPATPPPAFNNPFAALGHLADQLPSAPAGSEQAAIPPPSLPDAPSSGAGLRGKLVLRHERKGHGGKTATLLEGVALSGEALKDLARNLARELGTSARVRDGAILIGGDQRDRLREWLKAQGASKVVLERRTA